MTFAEKLFDHLASIATASGSKLTRETWLREVQAFADRERPVSKVNYRTPKGRNELFDTLALATGVRDLARLTRKGARTIAVALAEIREATPEVTPQEIQRAAAAYSSRHPTWALTAPALAKHWGEFGHASTASQRFDPYQEPPDWQALVRRIFPNVDPDRWPATWAEISYSVRSSIMEQLKQTDRK